MLFVCFFFEKFKVSAAAAAAATAVNSSTYYKSRGHQSIYLKSHINNLKIVHVPSELLNCQ